MNRNKIGTIGAMLTSLLITACTPGGQPPSNQVDVIIQPAEAGDKMGVDPITISLEISSEENAGVTNTLTPSVECVPNPADTEQVCAFGPDLIGTDFVEHAKIVCEDEYGTSSVPEGKKFVMCEAGQTDACGSTFVIHEDQATEVCIVMADVNNECPMGTGDCPCFPNLTCLGDLVCDPNTIVCGEPTDTEECTQDSDCDDGEVCNDQGICVPATPPECAQDTDCDDGEVCNDQGICVPEGLPCGNTECQFGEECVNDTCVFTAELTPAPEGVVIGPNTCWAIGNTVMACVGNNCQPLTAMQKAAATAQTLESELTIEGGEIHYTINEDYPLCTQQNENVACNQDLDDQCTAGGVCATKCYTDLECNGPDEYCDEQLHACVSFGFRTFQVALGQESVDVVAQVTTGEIILSGINPGCTP